MVVVFKSLHLLFTEVGGTQAVLKPVMNCTWKDHVIGTKLVNIFESLHGRLIDEIPTIMRQLHLVVYDIIDRLIFSRSQKLLTMIFSLDQVTSLTFLVLHRVIIDVVTLVGSLR